jgi:GH24 family phage-related lysozyme (muramidase)
MVDELERAKKELAEIKAQLKEIHLQRTRRRADEVEDAREEIQERREEMLDRQEETERELERAERLLERTVGEIDAAESDLVPELVDEINDLEIELAERQERIAHLWDRAHEQGERLRHLNDLAKARAARQEKLKSRRKETREEIERIRERFGEAGGLSDQGAAFIARFEGFPQTQPYNDPVGFCTVGYGHLLHRSGCTDSDRSEWSGITQEKGRELLRSDMRTYVAAVVNLIQPELNQPRLDALASFTMNNGAGSLEESTLRRRLNEGEGMDEVAREELPRWVMAGSPARRLEGLIRRRASEVKLFTTGQYG